ncbi:MAG: imidazole glycerol phosphate synthase subunit HisH [Burkholderiales bacterium]|nr:imidazole glycerol phosphate synthase subunit HisH [Burkholderiales bacterium]
MKLAIIDYGSGNLRSVQKACEKTSPPGTEVVITPDPDVVRKADKVIFPGQGAMPDCMANLRSSGLEEAVREALVKKPFFAICIGEQMLFDHSDEGDVTGLGIFPGNVVRFANDMTYPDGTKLKVPQMGWNRVKQTQNHPMWNGIPDNSWFYFVHSYYAVPKDDSVIAGVTDYGGVITVVCAKDNIFATQYHPEKSSAAGLKLYENFLAWSP